MKAQTPEELHRMWARAFGNGDIETALACYEPDAILMAQPGQLMQGRLAIRQALEGFLAARPHFDFEFRRSVETGDLALLYADWKLTGTGPDGSLFELSGQTSDVARRQGDGSWLIVIDNPYGGQGI